MTATLVVNADMGNYSNFLGRLGDTPERQPGLHVRGSLAERRAAGQSIEVLPNGTRIYVQQMSIYEYRSYFESTLYSADLLE